jgi:uncharacterized membrane protein
MSLPLATLIVALVAIVGNRIFAVLAGLWLRVPGAGLLTLLLVLDVVQIPFYYWLYENGSAALERLPASLRGWFSKDWSGSFLGKWTASLGGLGVMMVAAMPTLGGGMWSATFLAYGLGLRKRFGYLWMMLGSAVSYFSIYWILDTIFTTVRYFSH